jgi:hypothetical protein
MSHTTFVSAVSGSLQSARWPRQTCCKQSSQAFCVSPVSACAATSRALTRAQIGLSACWFVSASMTVRSGAQRPREYLIRRSVQPVQPVRWNPYPQVRVLRPSTLSARGLVLSSQSVRRLSETVDFPELAHTRRALSRNRVRCDVSGAAGDLCEDVQRGQPSGRPPGHRRVPDRVAAADARGNHAYRSDAGERPAGDESILKGRQI